MAPPWKVVLNQDCVDEILRAPKRHRERIIADLKRLSEGQMREGDVIEKDETDRELQVGRIGNWIVTWWFDTPVDELRIVRLERIGLK